MSTPLEVPSPPRLASWREPACHRLPRAVVLASGALAIACAASACSVEDPRAADAGGRDADTQTIDAGPDPAHPDAAAPLVPLDAGRLDGGAPGDAAAACASPVAQLEGEVAGVPASALRFLGASASECWSSSELTLTWADELGDVRVWAYVRLDGVRLSTIGAPLAGEVDALVFVAENGDDEPTVAEGRLRVDRLERVSFDATGPLAGELHASGERIDLRATIDAHVCGDFTVCL